MLRNKIGEAYCCNSKLLHFFEKSLIVVVEILAVLTDSSRRAEPFDANDRMWHNSDDLDIHGQSDSAADTRNTKFPTDKKHDDQQVKKREILDNESSDATVYSRSKRLNFEKSFAQKQHENTFGETSDLVVGKNENHDSIEKHFATWEDNSKMIVNQAQNEQR